MRAGLAATREFTIAILKKGPGYDPPRTDPIIWEHGRRNFALRASGVLPIVCPIRDQTDMAGVSIFDADPVTVAHMLSGDPAVQAGVLTYAVYPSRSFPGDCLPAERA
jgi:hypothetical protein